MCDVLASLFGSKDVVISHLLVFEVRFFGLIVFLLVPEFTRTYTFLSSLWILMEYAAKIWSKTEQTAAGLPSSSSCSQYS